MLAHVAKRFTPGQYYRRNGCIPSLQHELWRSKSVDSRQTSLGMWLRLVAVAMLVTLAVLQYTLYISTTTKIVKLDTKSKPCSVSEVKVAKTKLNMLMITEPYILLSAYESLHRCAANTFVPVEEYTDSDILIVVSLSKGSGIGEDIVRATWARGLKNVILTRNNLKKGHSDKGGALKVIQSHLESEKFRDVKWILLVESNTFVNYRQLLSHLSKFRYSVPILFGFFFDLKKSLKGQMGNNFVYPDRGAGMVLSRPAFDTVLANINTYKCKDSHTKYKIDYPRAISFCCKASDVPIVHSNLFVPSHLSSLELSTEDKASGSAILRSYVFKKITIHPVENLEVMKLYSSVTRERGGTMPLSKDLDSSIGKQKAVASFKDEIQQLYYINLDENTKRKSFMQHWLAKQGISYERVPAIRGVGGSSECVSKYHPGRWCKGVSSWTSSLLSIMDKKKTAGLTVVVEDDVYLPTKKIKSYISLVPTDWDVIRFDCNLDNKVPKTFKTFGKLVFKTNQVEGQNIKSNNMHDIYCGGINAMVWKEGSVKKIRKVLGRKPHDDPSCKLTTNDINSYCIQAGIVQHKYEFESEIPQFDIETSVDCKGHWSLFSKNRTCEYKNLVMWKKKFYYIPSRHAKKLSEETHGVIFTDRPIRVRTGYMDTYVFLPELLQNLQEVVKEKINRRNGIHAFFGRQWPNSVGHGVWNDIFAVFHSLVRFGYENSKFHPVVIDPKDSPCCRNEIDFRDFSGNKLEFLKDFSDGLYVFEKVVVGTSMLQADDVSLFRQWLSGYPRARNMLQKFRDRWYKSYSLSIANHYKFTNISKIVIIENKREELAMRNLFLWLRSNFPNEDVNYLEWKKYGSMAKLVPYLSTADIYISGVGTAMMWAPLLRDGSVVINLGEIVGGKSWGKQILYYLHEMDHMMSSGIRVLYYPPRIRWKNRNQKKIDFAPLKSLVDKAIRIFNEGFSRPVKMLDNAGYHAIVFYNFCMANKQHCLKIMSGMNAMGMSVEEAKAINWEGGCVHEGRYVPHIIWGHGQWKPGGACFKRFALSVIRNEIENMKIKLSERLFE